MPVPEEKNRPLSVFHASTRTDHSKKPDVVYKLIEQIYSNRKYLELFSRRRNNNDPKFSNWKFWDVDINNKIIKLKRE